MEKKKMEFAKPLSQLNPNIHCFYSFRPYHWYMFRGHCLLATASTHPCSQDHQLPTCKGILYVYHSFLIYRGRRFEDSDDITQLGVVICEDLSAADGGELPVAACARVVILD
ncbi:hypothetical protein IGI04_018666 [Brassica rapa subsp. trilocularis]|uniref:Uncharacterized protein n=1 Tax=Brassica rapa subsp. trilocularis TaxID=1813537 RepID=A0ABQ7ME24_BRACM|nr:hypothetical protein IGI04_018666 [Brassica rapa subsp. trilocularis]